MRTWLWTGMLVGSLAGCVTAEPGGHDATKGASAAAIMAPSPASGTTPAPPPKLAVGAMPRTPTVLPPKPAASGSVTSTSGGSETMPMTPSLPEVSKPPSAGIYSTKDMADWQKTLADDLADVEAKGDAFLQAAFALYDQLLAEGEMTAVRRQLVSKEVQDSADRYGALTTAIAQLEVDLGRQQIRASLPQTLPEGVRELAAVTALGAIYKPAVQRLVAYDTEKGPGIVAVLFGGALAGGGDELAELPKPQRDALQLLDALSDVSRGLTTAHDAVIGWVETRPDDADITAH